MPKTPSTQQKLGRVRPPRVQITYEVEIGDAIEMKELPFLMGIIGDYSGKPEQPLPQLKNRKFVEIDRDNFNQVMAGMKPRLTYRVDNKIANDGSKLNVELKFNKLDDFHPDNVVNQIEPLRRLVEARQRLSDLLSKMDGNDKLEQQLIEILENTELRQQLIVARGLEQPQPEAAAEGQVKEEPNA